MSRRGWVGFLRAGTALGLLVIVSAQANAGGFAIREQSTYGQGTSFAGIAAGGSLSSMFWNPATMTQFAGMALEMDATGIWGYASHTPLSGELLGFGGAPNSAQAGLPLASYTSYQLNPNLWIGYSITAPFGLSVTFPDRWAGRNYAGDSNIVTYNATPSIAYRINDWISVGAGVQIQYAKAQDSNGIGTTPGWVAKVEGKGWGYGFTAGVTLTPTPATTIGLGWRSAIDQDIDGTLVNTSPAPATSGSVSTELKLPDIVSLGIRHRLDPRWTLMGTVEWSNWSRIGTSTIVQPSGAPATIGGVPVTLPFQYQDGWFFSVGAEYQWTDRLTVRSGIGYEISPITDRVRKPDVPDNDRFWLSVGATWEVWKNLYFDVAYSHLWVQDPSINISATSGNPWFSGVTYIGDVNAHSDILSIALKYQFGAPAPPNKRLITK